MKRWMIFTAQIAVLLLIIIAGFGQAVLHLWNWLMPDLFGLRPITFWQAVGLMGLSWILFRGGFLGRPFRPYGPRHIRGRWHEMSPEQREAFREGLQRGRGCAPSAESKA